MVLVQLLLPLAPVSGGRGVTDEAIGLTRSELAQAFGGVTAYLRSPAQGVWRGSGGEPEQDDVVMVEVVARTFDREWWRRYSATLAARFDQQAMHVRAMPIELIDDDGV